MVGRAARGSVAPSKMACRPRRRGAFSRFKAIDARNCAPLWQFKTGSGIVGNPIAYRGPDGKQYIAVYSGVGGWMGAIAFPSLSTDDPYAALGAAGAMADIKQKTRMGGMLYVFGF